MLEAYGVDFDVLALLVCIQDEDKALLAASMGYQTLQLAVSEWSTDKGAAVSDFIGGLLVEVVAYQTAVQGLPACEHICTKDVEKLLPILADHDALMSPANLGSLFTKFEDDLQINGYSIIKMLFSAISAMENSEFEQYGYQLGRIMQLMDLPKPTKTVGTPLSTVKEGDVKDAASMVQGFFNGVGIVNSHYQDILVCIYEADQSALELYADIGIWEDAWKDKDLFETFFAAVFAFAFVQSVKQQVVPACENAFAKLDMTPMDNVVSVVENPFSHFNIVNNEIVLNGLPVTESIFAAGASFQEGDMFAFGENLGSIFSGAAAMPNYIV